MLVVNGKHANIQCLLQFQFSYRLYFYCVSRSLKKIRFRFQGRPRACSRRSTIIKYRTPFCQQQTERLNANNILRAAEEVYGVTRYHRAVPCSKRINHEQVGRLTGREGAYETSNRTIFQETKKTLCRKLNVRVEGGSGSVLIIIIIIILILDRPFVTDNDCAHSSRS